MGQVLCDADVLHILIWFDFNPHVVKHKEDTWEVAIAPCDHDTLLYDIIISANVLKDLGDEVIIEMIGKVQR